MSAKRKNTPPERRSRRNISFESTESGAGEQFLLQDYRAMVDTKGVFLSLTLVSQPSHVLESRPPAATREARSAKVALSRGWGGTVD